MNATPSGNPNMGLGLEEQVVMADINLSTMNLERQLLRHENGIETLEPNDLYEVYAEYVELSNVANMIKARATARLQHMSKQVVQQKEEEAVETVEE